MSLPPMSHQARSQKGHYGDPLLDRQLGLCDREIAFEIDSGAAEEV